MEYADIDKALLQRFVSLIPQHHCNLYTSTLIKNSNGISLYNKIITSVFD